MSRKSVRRKQHLEELVRLPPCKIGMEGRTGSNHRVREFMKLGHEARIVSPRFVKPYVNSSGKGDSSNHPEADPILAPVVATWPRS